MKKGFTYRLLTLVIGILVALFLFFSIFTRGFTLSTHTQDKMNSGMKSMFHVKGSPTDVVRVFLERF